VNIKLGEKKGKQIVYLFLCPKIDPTQVETLFDLSIYQQFYFNLFLIQ